MNGNNNTSTEAVPYQSCDDNESVNANDDMSISAVPYESMDDGSIFSIPQKPNLRKFANVSEDNEYENGYDSDGEIGPFFEEVMEEDAMDAYYIESADNFTAKSSAAPLPAEPTPTLTTTEKISTEASPASLPAEPTPTPTTTKKRGDALCACLDKCEILGHRSLSTQKCSYCQLNIHGICGVQNPKGDSSVTYSQFLSVATISKILHRLKLTSQMVQMIHQQQQFNT